MQTGENPSVFVRLNSRGSVLTGGLLLSVKGKALLSCISPLFSHLINIFEVWDIKVGVILIIFFLYGFYSSLVLQIKSL